MAGTRTVHRGSKGRFAGSSGGKAERVRVGKRSSLGTRAKNSVFGAKGSAKRQRVKGDALTLGVAAGLTVGTHYALKSMGASESRKRAARRSSLGPSHRGSTTYRNKGVGRKETVSMPRSPLVRRGTGATGRDILSGAIPMGSGGRVGGVKLNAAEKVVRANNIRAAAAAARPPSPNYGSAAGRKEFVGRRVTDGNFGFKLAKG